MVAIQYFHLLQQLVVVLVGLVLEILVALAEVVDRLMAVMEQVVKVLLGEEVILLQPQLFFRVVAVVALVA